MAEILLIEDDPAISETLSNYLKSEGYTIRTASGQRGGLELFRKFSPDCILLDVSLADGNGFSVCSAIRAVSETPVIFLTASADESCIVAGFELGADDYISKPFRPRELAARIRNVLRRYNAASKLLHCQNLILDPSKALVTKNGQEIFLSALEYRLLLLFLSNPGQLISRDRIADELWTISGEFIGDNTLNVYMKRLRDKIEDDPQNPCIIRTVRGLGYKAAES